MDIAPIMREFDSNNLQYVATKEYHSVHHVIFEIKANDKEYAMNCKALLEFVTIKFGKSWTKSINARLSKPRGDQWPWIKITVGTKKQVCFFLAHFFFFM